MPILRNAASAFRHASSRAAIPARSMIVAAVASALAGCPGATPPPQYPIQDSARIVSVMRAREARFHTMRATGTADHFGRTGRVRGAVTIYVRLPDRMRVEASAFGHVVSTVVSDGTRFSMLQGHQFIVGAARPCVSQQLIGIPMSAHDVVTVLSGGVPLVSDHLSPARWENGVYVTEADGENGAHQRIEFELPQDQRSRPADQQSPLLHRVELRDHEGVRATITYDHYRDVAGMAFPFRVRFVMPRDHADTQITLDQIVPDFTVPPDPDNPEAPAPDPFQLQRPNGADEVPIDC